MQIFLGGDSAGGNISLGVLSHLSHPHPDIPRLDISGNLRGVVLLSPWVTFEDTTASNVRNRESDIINTEHLALWSSLFMGDAPKDAYVEPLEAPDDWWRGAKTDGILLVGGSQEIMLDDIISMARKLEVRAWEVLVWWIVDVMTGRSKPVSRRPRSLRQKSRIMLPSSSVSWGIKSRENRKWRSNHGLPSGCRTVPRERQAP